MSARSASQVSSYASFEAWVATEQAAYRFSDETVAIYRSIWHAWLLWLPAGTDWKSASTQHVLAFLQGPAPGQGRRRRPKSDDEMANATQYRYLRVLRGVYERARRDKVIADSPLLGLGQDAPRLKAETREAQVLPPRVLQLLRRADSLRKLVGQGRQAPWSLLRDRAAIALLAHCGLTTGELIDLNGHDLLEHGKPMRGRSNLPLPEVEGPPVKLHVDAPRKGAEARTLDVHGGIHGLLREWLACREQVVNEDAARLRLRGVPAEAIPPLAKYPLFMSRQRRSEVEPLGRMEPATVYLCVRRCLDNALAHPGVRAIAGEVGEIGKGAAIIRNTVMAGWLHKHGEAETVRRAGLSGTDSLRVLRRARDEG